jgi:enamine deaminase RidA (YjgF/YER057c/UK114 family)
MSHLQYYSYDGVGQRNKESFWYSQAVRIGDRIECAGQGLRQPKAIHQHQKATVDNLATGGWDPSTGVIHREINAQIDQAFANVDMNLKHAGGKGWEQVFRVNSYHLPLNDEALDAMVRNFKRYMPSHQPIWTCVGVTRLGEDDMRIEIEVVAHDP